MDDNLRTLILVLFWVALAIVVLMPRKREEREEEPWNRYDGV